MKEMKKLKLVQLSQQELDKKDLNKLRGGGCCICACNPADTMENASANNASDLSSDGGGYGNGSFA